MRHLNGSILCVVDVETTGVIPRYHDLIEICVLPLNSQLRPSQGILPFNLRMKPKRPDNVDLEALRKSRHYDRGFDFDDVCFNKERILDTIIDGVDPYFAADLFDEWYQKLSLPPTKRIMPIAHNWVFDREFIIDWLDIKGFEMYFDPRYRDTMAVSLFENDKAEMRGEMHHPYPKNNLQYLCSQLKVEREKSHTALDDCVATAEVYRKLIQGSV